MVAAINHFSLSPLFAGRGLGWGAASANSEHSP